MDFRTIVDIPAPDFRIAPCESLLFVGSCFADSIGHHFKDEGFPVVVNPFGTMYNPASILHTLQRLAASSSTVPDPNGSPVSPATVPAGFPAGLPSTVFLTLGTNHVYRLKETGEIVDNCQKRPAALFQEEELSVDQCADYLRQSITLLLQSNPDVHIVLTVSPIRYRKYGYHESQLSKATLLLAIDRLLHQTSDIRHIQYFPAYEIVNDELRDYRFYAADMLHSSDQAVEYIWERLVNAYFSPEAKAYLKEWEPLKQALAHKPFNPGAPEYRAFMDKTMLKVEEIRKKYPTFAL